MLFTVNIATYNQLDSLKMILKGLEAQTFKNFEVSVTDDGSNDGTKEWMKKNHPDIRYYWYEKDGFQLAKSKNLGIDNASGEYFISLEGDVIPNKNMLSSYANNVKPDTIIYGVRHDIEKVPEEIDFSALDSQVIGKDFRLKDLRNLANITNPWRLCSGCNVLFPTRALREVGGWNESFRHYGNDDYEVCARLYAAGYKFKALPEAYAYHVRHEIHSSTDENNRLLEETERSLGLR